MEVSGQLHVWAASPQGKEPLVPTEWSLVRTQSRSGHGDEETNSQLLPEIEP